MSRNTAKRVGTSLLFALFVFFFCLTVFAVIRLFQEREKKKKVLFVENEKSKEKLRSKAVPAPRDASESQRAFEEREKAKRQARKNSASDDAFKAREREKAKQRKQQNKN
jgi:hypothetical protein